MESFWYGVCMLLDKWMILMLMLNKSEYFLHGENRSVGSSIHSIIDIIMEFVECIVYYLFGTVLVFYGDALTTNDVIHFICTKNVATSTI